MYGQEAFSWLPVIIIGLITASAVILWLFIGPRYGVWSSKLSGQADLEQAHFEQEIIVAKAKSRLNAAEMNKKASIIEAEAVSEQIKRIGENLQKHDLYLKWQWIKMMEERPKNSVIYVPTEAGLPILEAGRIANKN